MNGHTGRLKEHAAAAKHLCRALVEMEGNFPVGHITGNAAGVNVKPGLLARPQLDAMSLHAVHMSSNVGPVRRCWRAPGNVAAW